MKKDIDKLFSESLHTYYFLLIVIVIIKLLGSDWFDIVENNTTINMISSFVKYWRLENIWYGMSLYINVYITISITCSDDSKKLKLFILCLMPFIILIQYLKNKFGVIMIIFDIIYLFLISIAYMIFNKKVVTKNNILNYIVYMLISILLQMFSMIIRNQNLSEISNNFYINFVLNLDYFIMLIILYKLYFKKGGDSLCQMVVFYGSQKLTSLKSLLKNLQIKLQDRRKLNKREKIIYSIYTPLYLLWDLFTMVIIGIIAILNNTLIECLFITIAFWINKRSFGKPFHFKKVMTCFCFSSLVYYGLTRITFSIKSSIFIPIFLGVSLSYITSHFLIKETKLYKGMSEELFYNTIRQVTDDELTIKMCKEFYCDRLTDKCVGIRNNYSSETVRKKRQKVNAKLKDL